jgi:ATP synthase protein I
MSDRTLRSDPWPDKADAVGEEDFKPLTPQEAQALRAGLRLVSPWRVVSIQAAAGVLVTLVGLMVTGKPDWAWSLLYGAAAVVVPSALMAHGMTRRRPVMTPGSLAVSFMLWELVKIMGSVAMLGVANWILQPPVWPALLVGVVVALKMYWAALLWQRRSKT